MRIAIAILAILALAPPISASWLVDQDGGGDFTTIQGGVNAAASGDTIFVNNGIYQENVLLYLRGINLTLIGEDPSGTIIDAGGSGSCLLIRDTHPTSGEIRGFTFYNSGDGSAYGVGDCGLALAIYGGGIWLVEDNIFTNHDREGLFLMMGEATVTSNLFKGIDGACITASTGAVLTVENNDFFDADTGIYNTASVSVCTAERNIFSGLDLGLYFPPGPGYAAGCNAFWNVATTYSDNGLAADDIEADPQFCGAAGSGNYYLQSDSPCAPGNHPGGYSCGLIGARGVLCDDTLSRRETWSAVKALY